MLTNELEGVNKDVYKTDWQWQEGEYTVTRTNMWTAPGCHNGCSTWRGLEIPFGGYKMSGLGREGGRYSLLTMSQEKTVAIRYVR